MKLSIVLPLRGREEFTKRFIKTCGDIGNLILADGSEVPQTFAQCHGDYFYAGPDTSLQRWWFKMTLAFDRVGTPYAMVADNDDLLVRSGINCCIEFLDRNPDYIACSGRLEGFWMWPDLVYGPHTARTKRYALYDLPADYGQPTASERVLAGFQNSWSYYAVYRTEALNTIWREVCNIGFSDLQIHEKFCAMRALSLGKIKCDGGFASYLRQIGTSSTAASSAQIDFAARLITNDMTKDRDAVLKQMADCGVDIEALRNAWAAWYKGYLLREYGPWKQLRQAAKARLPRLASIVQNRHHYLPLRWGYR